MKHPSKALGYVGLCVFTAAVLSLSGTTGRHNQARGTTFYCQSTTCPHNSTCSGTYVSKTGCAIQCWVDKPNGSEGEIQQSGSANCSTTGGGSGGTPPPGGGGGCDAVWWDGGCSGEESGI